MDAKEFFKLNGRCVSGKALITKTCNKFEQLCEEMDQMEEGIPELSRVRKATFLTEQVDKVRKAMDNLETNAQTLMEAVWELPAGSRTKDAQGSEMTEQEMYNNISTKIQEYVDKAEGVLRAGEKQIQKAESILHSWAKPEEAKPQEKTQDRAERNPEFWKSNKRFHPQQNLRPPRLEKESTMEEVAHFNTCLEAFLMDGFSGDIPQESIVYQVCPLVNSFWWKILVDRGIKKCDLPGVMSEITKLGAEFNPLH